MKTQPRVTGLTMACMGLLSQTLCSAPIYKINNTDPLNQLSSWSTTSGAQEPHPLSIGPYDTWYFNETTMMGYKSVPLGNNLVSGGIALDWVNQNDSNQLTITGSNTLTLVGGTLYGSGQHGTGTAFGATGILLARSTGGSLEVLCDLRLGADQNWVTARPIAIQGNLDLNGSYLTVRFLANSTITLDGEIHGSGGFSLTEGPGVLRLAGDNSSMYASPANLGNGTSQPETYLEIGHPNALSSMDIMARGAVLKPNIADYVCPNRVFLRAGGFHTAGSHDFTMSGPFSQDDDTRFYYNHGSKLVTMSGNLTLTGTSATKYASFESGRFRIDGNISGKGSLRTRGAELTLAGTSTYDGTTLVDHSAARLNLDGSLGSNIQVGAGSIAGTGSTTGVLVTDANTFVRHAGGESTGSFTVHGATFAGPTTVIFDTPPLDGHVYDILSYGAGPIAGEANLVVPYRGMLEHDTVARKFRFTSIGPGQTRTWNTTSGTWSAGATNPNWQEGDQFFYHGDHVIFGDGPSNATVTIDGPLYPASVVVQNSVNTYSFEGGPLTGASSLTKTGGGTLVLANANTYKGSTTVSGGILAVNGTSLEDTSALVIDGGMVEIAGTETVDALYYGNSRQPAGTYGSGTSDATFKDNTRFSGSGMLMVGSGPEPDYTSWAAKNAPTGTAADDYDGDGVENGVEYALGGHAGINDCTRLPVLTLNEGSMVFSFSYVHGAAATLAIEVGNNLNSWADSYTVGSSPEVEVSDNGDGTDFVSLTLPRAPGGLLFLRLKVSVD